MPRRASKRKATAAAKPTEAPAANATLDLLTLRSWKHVPLSLADLAALHCTCRAARHIRARSLLSHLPPSSVAGIRAPVLTPARMLGIAGGVQIKAGFTSRATLVGKAGFRTRVAAFRVEGSAAASSGPAAAASSVPEAPPLAALLCEREKNARAVLVLDSSTGVLVSTYGLPEVVLACLVDLTSFGDSVVHELRAALLPVLNKESIHPFWEGPAPGEEQVDGFFSEYWGYSDDTDDPGWSGPIVEYCTMTAEPPRTARRPSFAQEIKLRLERDGAAVNRAAAALISLTETWQRESGRVISKWESELRNIAKFSVEPAALPIESLEVYQSEFRRQTEALKRREKDLDRFTTTTYGRDIERLEQSISDVGYGYWEIDLPEAELSIGAIRSALVDPARASPAVEKAVAALRKRLRACQALHRTALREDLYEEYDLDAEAAAGGEEFEEMTAACKTSTGLMLLYLTHAAVGAEDCGLIEDPRTASSGAARNLRNLHPANRSYDWMYNDRRTDSYKMSDYDRHRSGVKQCFNVIKKDVIQRAINAVRGGRLLFGLIFAVEVAVAWAQQTDYGSSGHGQSLYLSEKRDFDDYWGADLNRMSRMIVLLVGEAAVPILSLPENEWIRRWWVRCLEVPAAEDKVKQRTKRQKQPTWTRDSTRDEHHHFWGVLDGLALMSGGASEGWEEFEEESWRWFEEDSSRRGNCCGGEEGSYYYL